MRKTTRRTVLSSLAVTPFLGSAAGRRDPDPPGTDPSSPPSREPPAQRVASDPEGVTRFTILHTNDEHSHLLPFPVVDDVPDQANPTRGGFARLASAIEDERRAREADGQEVFLISGGDVFAGPPFGWLPLEGLAPELALMQRLGYDAVVIGNHEFDYGPEVLAEYLDAGGYPEAHEDLTVLGTNITPPAAHPLSDVGLRDTTTLELRDGTRIGLFGLIGEDAVRVAPLTDPVAFADQHETARLTAEHLRAEGADIVVAITHSGVGEDRALARAVDGLDLIIGGHSHTAIFEPIVESGTIIVQAGYHVKFLGVLELAYDPATGSVQVVSDQPGSDVLIPIDASVPADPDTAAVVEGYEAVLHGHIDAATDGTYRRFDDVVMYSEFALQRGPPAQESALGNLVTDAMRLETQAVLGEPVDVAFQADGLIREDLHPGQTAPTRDRVLFYDLATVAGVGSGFDGRPGYPIVSFWVTEEELLRAFEISVLLSEVLGASNFLQVSGARMTFDPDRAVWLTVPRLDVPIPAYRAAMRVERYVGPGVQDDERYEVLEGGDRLHRVVLDLNVALQIPIVGDLVPRLTVEPKDAAGDPIDPEDAIVHHDDGRELKVWETLVRYAADQPTDADGRPWLADRYRASDDRLVQASGFPLLAKPAAGLAALGGAIGYGIKRRRSG